LLIRIASLYHNLHEMTATAVEKPECTLYCKHFRDEVKMNCDVVSTPSRRYPVRRNVAGALSLVALVAGKRKPPHVERYNLTTERGLILNQNNSRIAAKCCHYNKAAI
jgi:small toxic polypeptide LdrA/B/C/D